MKFPELFVRFISIIFSIRTPHSGRVFEKTKKMKISQIN